ncbi:PaaX-like protein C-terminal domain protein [Aeromicrobium marinum DSM 15272]|uniref:PaaX-like protein C-terminal domain protein n=1 Tax=Aeromicrobium marinum DSM 15272 TaxID=585531 RepID=E2S8U6_9ACTN|nr:hypothetical protein [Aeromicrobium marinum]EFQ84601.1 PaaX-like protein C-terminal domain protein [Aeromicrobium marinum DSM 15272]
MDAPLAPVTTGSLTARSVVLSLLLGAHPARLPVRHLLALGEEFGISPSTLRVALSRMVAAGDLTNEGAVYALTPRHLARQAAQDADLDPVELPYDGTWDLVVVTGTGRDAATRADHRAVMRARRMAELREGVWTRPATLDVVAPIGPDVEVFAARPASDVDLAGRLWDLPAWAAVADTLLATAHGGATLATRFVNAAAIVRHLRTDPVLPPSLRPRHWPAAELRRAYETFRTELTDLHEEIA